MTISTTTEFVFGEKCKVELMNFDVNDEKKWKELFDSWKHLKLGMRDYKSREPNFPEGLSEVAFCLYSGSKRLISLAGNSSSSFDTYNTKTKKAEQIKACSVEDDLTSFGPRSKWDDLYFLDFYNDGKLDGRFDVFLVPSEILYSHKINRSQSFLDQQKEGRRPRLHLKKDILIPRGMKPLDRNVKVW